MANNIYFNLQYESTNDDIWGKIAPWRDNNISRQLFVNHFETDLGTPSYKIQNSDDFDVYGYQILFLRPVNFYIKTKTSVLDGMLKVGGLLGFLKIFSAVLGWVHMLLFKRALKRDL